MRKNCLCRNTRVFLVFLLVFTLLALQLIAPNYGHSGNEGYVAAIKTAKGNFLCSEDGGGKEINATRETVGEWETFEIINLGKGYAALRSHDGSYIRTTKDGKGVYSDSSKIGNRETFKLIALKDDKLAFMTYDKKYLCAEDGGGGKLTADRDNIGEWETFELLMIEPTASDRLQLTALAGDKAVVFSWNKPSSTKNIIGYNLYRGTASGKESSTPITDFPIEKTSYTDYNINVDTNYYYVLRVVYKNNVLGSPSNEVSVALGSKITLKSETAAEGIYLYWNKPTESKNIVGYYLYRATASGRQSTTPITDFPIEGTQYNDKNVEENTNYYYILKPVYKDKTLGAASKETYAKSGTRVSTVLLEVGSRYMYVNGQRKDIDPGNNTVVIIKNGRTFLPIRAVIEALGGDVQWRESDKRVSIYLKRNTIQLWINNKLAKVNGANRESDVAPYISDTGRTMLPLRFIAENLDCEVDWDGLTKRVTITAPR
ncbi:MAG: stalk domain-containing protein [Tissierellaceae bacterium]